MKNKIYSLQGGDATTGVAYDEVSLYFTWENPRTFEELKELATNPKKKFSRTTELSSVSKLALYPGHAQVMMDYMKKGKKDSVSFAFMSEEECTEFLDHMRKVCKLNSINKNANGKLDIAKEVMGIIGIVLFFTVMLIFLPPNSDVRPTKQLVKLVADLIDMLGYIGTITVALLLIAPGLWKISKKNEEPRSGD